MEKLFLIILLLYLFDFSFSFRLVQNFILTQVTRNSYQIFFGTRSSFVKVSLILSFFPSFFLFWYIGYKKDKKREENGKVKRKESKIHSSQRVNKIESHSAFRTWGLNYFLSFLVARKLKFHLINAIVQQTIEIFDSKTKNRNPKG